MHKRIIIFLMLLSMAPFTGMAQEDDMSCPEKLAEARRRFENGRFYSIPRLLEECVRKGLNDQQRIEAYFLLSQTYLFIDEPEKAEESYLAILRIDPEFEPDNERAPIDQVYLSEKFTTRPIFIASGRLGANYTSVDVIEEFSTSDQPIFTEYNLGVGFEIAGALDVVFSDFLSVGTELGVIQKKYTYKQSMFEDDEQTMVESQWNFEIPLVAKLRWDFNKLTPYVYGGPAINYTISSSADITTINRLIESPEINSEKIENTQVSMMDQRVKLTYAFIVGGGLQIKTGYNYLKVDLRYRNGLNNIVDKNGQYQNDELVFRYFYVDDYKRLNNLVLSVGYVKPFYKPRKKRKYR